MGWDKAREMTLERQKKLGVRRLPHPKSNPNYDHDHNPSPNPSVHPNPNSYPNPTRWCLLTPS